MISILMMNSQQVLITDVKLPPAFSTNEAMDFKGLFPVITGWGTVLLEFFENICGRLLFLDTKRPFISHIHISLLYPGALLKIT